MGISEKKVHTLEQGEDKEIEVYLLEDDEVVDLTDADEITARFKKDDGTALEKTLTDTDVEVLSIAGGKIKIKLSESDTAELPVDDRQDFDVVVEVGSDTTVIKFERSLTVKAPVV